MKLLVKFLHFKIVCVKYHTIILLLANEVAYQSALVTQKFSTVKTNWTASSE